MISSSISPEHQRLLALLSRIGYGRMENVEIRNGNLVPGPGSRILVSVMTTDGNAGARTPRNAFTLKNCQERFLERLSTIGNGIIRSITIQNGLPVQFDIEEELTAI